MTPPQARRPSISSPMTWLSRASSSASQSTVPYAPSKPVRISEPKFSSFDSVTRQRSGVLGSGAIVVRTPQEALGRCESPVADQATTEDTDSTKGRSSGSIKRRYDGCPSPPLPPIPLTEVSEAESNDRPLSLAPARPTRPPPAVPAPEAETSSVGSASPQTSTLRSSMKSSRSPPPSEYYPPVPELPANVPASPPQATFEPILLSSPAGVPNPSKIIVTLETTTQTYRTTYNTLVSRPSFLATYLQTLVPSRRRESDAGSTYSCASDADSSFNSIFHHHLASSGVLSQSSNNIHLFLDRPSAPYAHILSYLRTPSSTPENPAALPRAAQLTSNSSSRLEALLELRDEARYLDLDELYKLCTEEIRQRQAATASPALGLHLRGFSNSSSASSVRSLHTLRDDLDTGTKARRGRRNSNDSGFASTTKGAGSIVSEVVSEPPPPAPVRLLRGRSQRKEGTTSLRSRPTGEWI
ncbi:hypothetical protein CERSUDRAFT_111328 [Gelatoporia subvermispora B]|uniref:BTB domain-containing protein n=1 Tax=Ceriporiopsis subvermispora (strain B) TaxID=914234 RepID=M2QUK1_CERS8|nr:hypothetical protein CERSUDRAFT_111328 [Gelatoporia subvermispora B]